MESITRYTSKPLKYFIYEGNCENDIFFTLTKEDAINRLKDKLQ
ncbi:MAG: hypothetical protein RHS_0447 [Robinsoniella sp. RHS]|nr:DUF4180 domain-containing protein [Robinsoniella peoriensis]KLU73591.1 MAG: hypothetical protein RHS_0447 [Robinsoniella sp. RHS]